MPTVATDPHVAPSSSTLACSICAVDMGRTLSLSLRRHDGRRKTSSRGGRSASQCLAAGFELWHPCGVRNGRRLFLATAILPEQLPQEAPAGDYDLYYRRAQPRRERGWSVILPATSACGSTETEQGFNDSCRPISEFWSRAAQAFSAATCASDWSNEGHDVVCVDNFFTSQKTNVAHLLPRPNFELVRHDIIHPLFLEVDEIYNLACPAAPGHYQYNPIKTMKTSVMGAINMLGMAKRCRAKILQASTSEVYGDPDVHPQPESYRGNVNPIGPRACYDEGKRAAETLFMDYHRMNKVKVRLVRIFNTYGPGMHPFDGRVVSNFVRQALAGEDITIFGEGDQTRSFCYRDDLIEGIMRMMNGPDDFFGPVNLGNPGEFTIKQLAELVIELTGAKSKLVYRPLPADDPTQRKPDITLAQEKLGWQPTIPLREGLTKTIAWFRSIDIHKFRAPTPNY